MTDILIRLSEFARGSNPNPDYPAKLRATWGDSVFTDAIKEIERLRKYEAAVKRVVTMLREDK